MKFKLHSSIYFKAFFSFILVILFSKIALSQPDEDSVLDSRVISKIKIEHCNAKQNFGNYVKDDCYESKTILFNTDGKVSEFESDDYKLKYEYDSTGKIIRTIAEEQYINHKYDGDLLVSLECIKNTGRVFWKKIYTYNEMKNLTVTEDFDFVDNPLISWALKFVWVESLSIKYYNKYLIGLCFKDVVNYNDQQLIMETISYNTSGEISIKTNFEYDKNMQLIKKSVFKPECNNPIIYIYEYNAKKLVKKCTIFECSGDTIINEFAYNNNDSIVYEYKKRSSQKEHTVILREYDDIGQVIKIETIYVYDQMDFKGYILPNKVPNKITSIFKYSENGELVYFESTDTRNGKSGNYSYPNTYTNYYYEYDEYGNWIKWIAEYHNHNPTMICREITYR
jgi:hypothetical protein